MKLKASLYTFLCSIILTSTAFADAENTAIRYFSDPIHPSIHQDYQGHPLAHLKYLAEQKNDARAQFMMGDMLAKGKGGFAKDEVQAYIFFQQSGKGGNPHAFIRLAAMAFKQNKALEAYQWYFLGSQYFPKGENRIYMIRQKNQLSRTHDFNNADIRKVKKNIKIWHDTDFQYPELPALLDLTQKKEEEKDTSSQKDDETEMPAVEAQNPAAVKTETTITEKKESKENDKNSSQEPNR